MYEKAEECGLILVDNIGKRYYEVEYLESTGKQYIDTGIIYNASNTYDITTELCFTKLGDDQLSGWDAGGAFGTRRGLFYNGTGFTENIIKDEFYQIELDINLTRSNLIVNSNQIMSRGHGALSTYATDKGYPIFAMVSQNRYVFYLSAKLKFMKIKENNNLVRDFMPVLDSNDIPCLFDKVSKECFYNQGTGEFLYE